MDAKDTNPCSIPNLASKFLAMYILGTLPNLAKAARRIYPSLLRAILLAFLTVNRFAAATAQPDYLSDHTELILSSTQD